MAILSSVLLHGALAFVLVQAFAAAEEAQGIEKVKREAAFWKRNNAFWKRDTEAMLAHAGENEALLAEAEQQAEHVLDKRGSSYLGKRPRNNFLGKRADDDDVDFDIEELKRARQQFLGKRGRQQFLGKRGRMQFLGKREDADMLDQDIYGDNDLKRARYFLGKRAGYLFADDDQEFDDVDDDKRAKYFLGKRRYNFLGRR